MNAATGTADLLATIVAAARRVTEIRADREPIATLERRALGCQPRPGAFTAALSRPGRWNIIAECKRRSPSRGVLRNAYDPVAVALGYASAGAAAISVLTEPTFFDGAVEHLVAVRAAVRTPILRKDFIVSEYQLLEARAAGADAVLLIVAALTQEELTRLMRVAESLELDVLVEVHDRRELAVAVDVGASVIGVNNRNLRTLVVDVHASESLVGMIPKSVVAVSESGLQSPSDLTRLSALGYGAFLIGERFMTQPDPGAGLAALLEAAPCS